MVVCSMADGNITIRHAFLGYPVDCLKADLVHTASFDLEETLHT